jgi:hypothetical protein
MSVTRLHTPGQTARPAGGRLTTDGEIYNLGRGPETGFQRIQRLQVEARMLARQEVESLCSDIAALAARAAQIAEGGDAYPAGVREMASRLAGDLPERAKGMLAIAERMASDR